MGRRLLRLSLGNLPCLRQQGHFGNLLPHDEKVAGVHAQPAQINLVPLTYIGLQIIGTAGADDTVIRLVMEILASHKFPVENMITHTYPQEKIVEAIEMAGNVKEAVKVVIKFSYSSGNCCRRY